MPCVLWIFLKVKKRLRQKRKLGLLIYMLIPLYVDTTGTDISYDDMEGFKEELNTFFSGFNTKFRFVNNGISTFDGGPIDDDNIYEMVVNHPNRVSSDEVIDKFRDIAPGGDDLNVSTVFQHVYCKSEKFLRKNAPGLSSSEMVSPAAE